MTPEGLILLLLMLVGLVWLDLYLAVRLLLAKSRSRRAAVTKSQSSGSKES